MTKKYGLTLKIIFSLGLFFGAFGLVEGTWVGDGGERPCVSSNASSAWSDCESARDPGAGKYCRIDAANSYASAGDTIYFKGRIYSITGMYAEGLSPKTQGL
jgi:hypothetical protein